MLEVERRRLAHVRNSFEQIPRDQTNRLRSMQPVDSIAIVIIATYNWSPHQHVICSAKLIFVQARATTSAILFRAIPPLAPSPSPSYCEIERLIFFYWYLLSYICISSCANTQLTLFTMWVTSFRWQIKRDGRPDGSISRSSINKWR